MRQRREQPVGLLAEQRLEHRRGLVRQLLDRDVRQDLRGHQDAVERRVALAEQLPGDRPGPGRAQHRGRVGRAGEHVDPVDVVLQRDVRRGRRPSIRSNHRRTSAAKFAGQPARAGQPEVVEARRRSHAPRGQGRRDQRLHGMDQRGRARAAVPARTAATAAARPGPRRTPSRTAGRAAASSSPTLAGAPPWARRSRSRSQSRCRCRPLGAPRAAAPARRAGRPAPGRTGGVDAGADDRLPAARRAPRAAARPAAGHGLVGAVQRPGDRHPVPDLRAAPRRSTSSKPPYPTTQMVSPRSRRAMPVARARWWRDQPLRVVQQAAPVGRAHRPPVAVRWNTRTASAVTPTAARRPARSASAGVARPPGAPDGDLGERVEVRGQQPVAELRRPPRPAAGRARRRPPAAATTPGRPRAVRRAGRRPAARRRAWQRRARPVDRLVRLEHRLLRHDVELVARHPVGERPPVGQIEPDRVVAGGPRVLQRLRQVTAVVAAGCVVVGQRRASSAGSVRRAR